MRKTILFVVVFWGACSLPAFANDSGASMPAIPSNFESIKPILQMKCATCHASEADRPFSSKIPLFNLVAGTNIRFARNYYDIDELLEKGDAASKKEMARLEHVIRKNEMPPPPYKLFHHKKRVSSAEREAILSWIYKQYPDWKKNSC